MVARVLAYGFIIVLAAVVLVVVLVIGFMASARYLRLSWPRVAELRRRGRRLDAGWADHSGDDVAPSKLRK